MRPDWCPQRVWAIAVNCTGVGGGHEMAGVVQTQRESIADAILAAEQREREAFVDMIEQFGSAKLIRHCRTAIRNRTQEPS